MNPQSQAELEQLDRLAQFDRLIDRLSNWVNSDSNSNWEPILECQSLLKRVLSRAEALRIRLESPLVVATFGGTGTGKSSLVNAIVGEECALPGRQRPTTKRPTLIAHPKTDLESLELPLEDFDVVRVQSPLLQDVLIIDCPDPDTSEENQNQSDDSQTNLERLKRILPHCDVLVYTSTQQKYRSAKVKDELGQAATGCRLVFVQTHADVDSNILEDWKKHLEIEYSVPEMFFVDSVRGLQEQQDGKKPTGDLGRLQTFLIEQLDASHRTQIRRANVVDLIQSAVNFCKEKIDRDWPEVEELEKELHKQQTSLQQVMSKNLTDELLVSRNAWERRLISAVTERWGMSPFSAMLRLYRGLGGMLASVGLMRARTTAHVAVIGAIQGMRWLGERSADAKADSSLKRVGHLGPDDGKLNKVRLIIDGFARSAKLKSNAGESQSLDHIKQSVNRVEEEFLVEAGDHVDQIIERLAKRNSGTLSRIFYEFLFIAYIGFVLFRIGKNFFYDSFVMESEILKMDFYIPALVFFVLWTGTLIILVTRKLRSGLNREIKSLSNQLVESQLSQGLFPDLETSCSQIRQERQDLSGIKLTTEELQSKIRNLTQLGSPNRS